jgi:hypothetical protein
MHFRQAQRSKPAGNLFLDKMFEKFPVIATRSDWVALAATTIPFPWLLGGVRGDVLGRAAP